MSDQNAWMPLYVGDYLADTMHLTGPEHGAYLLLLMHAWRSGPLPSEERKLAAIARTEVKAWREMSETVLDFFTMTEAGLVQGRLERIRIEQGAKIEQRRAAGKASAEARKAQRKSNDRSTTVEAPLPPRTREPEPESEREEPSLRSGDALDPMPPAKASRKRPAIQVDLPDWLPATAWANWCEHRKGAKFTQLAAELCIRDLGDLREKGNDPTAVIEQSIASGWVGLFALKSRAGSAPGKASPMDSWLPSRKDERPLYDFEITADEEPRR